MNNDVFTVISLKKTGSFVKFYDLETGFAYFKNYRLNLKTNFKERYPIKNLFKILQAINFNSEFKRPSVFHLFYELGHIINNENFVKEDDLLAIELLYRKDSPYILKPPKHQFKLESKKSLSQKEYLKKFHQVKDHLLKGNSYQMNLTFPFEFTLKGDSSIDNLVGKIWCQEEDRGAYAHLSVIPTLNKVFISNSPECLFQIKRKKPSLILWSMPIKGTLKIGKKKNYKKDWEILKKCPKNQAELFMISDLLKNDLSKIEKPNARVIFNKRPLRVPNILHQYSLISVVLSQNINLNDIVRNIFPGGSVTGAPKKRSMEIIFELESEVPRGFYCGSTIILHKSLMAGSINIRSATFDTKIQKFLYGSGGGITLLSEPSEEFGEMNLKFNSFLRKILN